MLEYPEWILKQAQSGDIAGAMAALTKRVETNAFDVPSLDLLGLLHFQAGQVDQALIFFRRAASAPGRNPLTQFHCGQAAEAVGQEWEALANYRQAWKVLRDFEIGFALAKLLRSKHEFEEAITVLRSLVALYPNSGEAFAELKSALRDLETAVYRGNFRNHQPVLFAALWHSGSSYITGEIARRAGLYLHEESIVTPDHTSIINASQLQKFLNIGGVLHSHVSGRKANLVILDSLGVKKINVHVRDPRQSFFSTTLYRDYLHRTPEAGDKFTAPLLEAMHPPGYFDLPLEEKIDQMIEHQLRIDVEWIQDWLKAAEDRSYGFEIQVTKFEDFKRDYDSFFASLLRFFEIDASEFKGERYESKPGSKGKLGDHALRKGEKDEWRHKTTERQRQRISELVPPELLRKLGYPL